MRAGGGVLAIGELDVFLAVPADHPKLGVGLVLGGVDMADGVSDPSSVGRDLGCTHVGVGGEIFDGYAMFGSLGGGRDGG